MNSNLLVGIDLGATRIKAGLIDRDGTMISRRERPVGDARTPPAIRERLAELAAELDPSGEAPIGIAVAGVIEHATQVIRESPNFPAWRDFHLAAELGADTGRIVCIENDANAAILGEACVGAGRGAPSVIGLTLGTGVGGGIVLDGRLHRGERGMAGELGHLTVVPDGRSCNCGNRGCLERYAGALGILETMAAYPGADAAWMAASGDRDHGVAWLASMARQGHPAAVDVFEQVGRALGFVLAGLVHVFDVRRFVLAGGIARSTDLFHAAMMAELRARTFRSMAEGVEVVVGTLGDDAALFGASVLARAERHG